MSTTNVPNQNLRTPRLVGWGLIILAFAIPALGIARGAYDGIELVVTLIGATITLFVVTAVAWIITRTCSRRTKAYGRVAVGLLLCLNMSVKLSNDIQDHEANKEYARQLSEMRQQQAAFAEALQHSGRLD